MTTNLQTNYSSLYDYDYYQWLDTTKKQIHSGDFDTVDWENLLEELESLGRSDQRELRNRLTVLLEHLLKLFYWVSERENNARGWMGTIAEQRDQINILLSDSPSLKRFLLEVFPTAYTSTKKITSAKTGLIFPVDCPFSLEQTLDDNFLTI